MEAELALEQAVRVDGGELAEQAGGGCEAHGGMLDAVPEREDLSRELRDCLRQREAGDIDGLFFRRDEYPDWLARAVPLQEEARRQLDAAEERSAGRKEEPGIDRLRDLKAELDGALREDREKIERIENERREQSHGQDRSRGFSM